MRAEKYEWDRLIIRPALPGDEEKIINLVTSILNEYGFSFDLGSSESDLINIDETYARNGGAFEIIEDREGNLLGTYGLQQLVDGMCKLRKMYLAPEVRGVGLGTHIMQRAIRKARELGFTSIMLETTTAMNQAISLYIRSGFKEIERPAQSPRCDRVFLMDLSH